MCVKAKTENNIDNTDMRILNRLQKGIPIVDTPFDVVATELGIEVNELLKRISKMKESGFIRRFGGVFDTPKMGYKSILIGLSVPKKSVGKASEVINTYSGVTHNYYRDGDLNIWFTLSTKSEEEKQKILNEISQNIDAFKIYQFPSEHYFKLNVFFDMEGAHDS